MRNSAPWPVVRLRDIATICSGGTPPREDSCLWGGGVPWLTPGELNDSTGKIITHTAESITERGVQASGAVVLPAGALMVTTRATLGACAIAGVPMATNQGFKNLVFERGIAEPDFYFYLLKEYVREMKRRASGTTFLELSAREFGDLEVPLPGIVDQRRIVEMLDSCSDQERSVRDGILKLRRLRSGILEQAFREGVCVAGFGESASRGRGWPLRAIGELCRVSSGLTPSRAASSRYFAESGVPWVKTLDLNEGPISITQETLTEAAISELNIRRFPVGSVLVAMYGGWQQIGRTSILGVPAAVNQAISVLEVLGGLNPNYLLLAMQNGRQRWSKFAASTRKDPNITKSDVLDFVIPVPPLEEQARIVELAAAPLREIASDENCLIKLRNLKKGLVRGLISAREGNYSLSV